MRPKPKTSSRRYARNFSSFSARVTWPLASSREVTPWTTFFSPPLPSRDCLCQNIDRTNSAAKDFPAHACSQTNPARNTSAAHRAVSNQLRHHHAASNSADRSGCGRRHRLGRIHSRRRPLLFLRNVGDSLAHHARFSVARAEGQGIFLGI